MRHWCMAALCCVPLALLAGEPGRTAATLFLCNFDSLTSADFAAGSATMQPKGAALGPGRWGKGLHVGPDQYVAIPAEGNLDPKQGTIMFWFRPNWSTKGRTRSHALISWGWEDGKDGYCVLSDGWWEPAGAGRTYLVFENQLYAHVSDTLTYTQGDWMHFTFTWEFGKRLVATLYLNGQRVRATSARAFKTVPSLKTRIVLGADTGTPIAQNRCADGVIDGFHVMSRALTADRVRDEFRGQEPNWQELERQTHAWLYDVLERPHQPERDGQGRILESRALLDEQCRWATREGAQAAVEKLAAAGFNVYIPCVWHGRGAWWPSRLTPMEPRVEKMVKGEGEGFDPLENMIRLCHAKGIEVHPWFCVCYGDRRWPPLAPFIEEGTPKGACEAHNPAFRNFIVDLMMEVVRKYDVDGLNLDYIRTKGVSTSKTARDAYSQRFGSDLLTDLKKPEPNGWPNAKVVQFQNDAVGDIVRRVSEQARAARPGIVMSIDGHPYLPTEPPNTQGRDGFGWAQKGWIDVLYTMDYGRRLRWQKADAIRAALTRPAALVIIAGNYERLKNGKVGPREGQLVADLIAFCQRKYPGNGVALYWMGSLDDAQVQALRIGPFRDPAIPHWRRAATAQ